MRKTMTKYAIGSLVVLLHGLALAQFGSGSAICTAPIAPVPVPTTPTEVTTCTRNGIQNAIDSIATDGSGHITFNCGATTTIAITTPLQLNGQDLVLDGGGVITLDGGNSSRILENPFTAGGNTLVIQNIRMINARGPAATNTRDGNARGGAIRSGSPGTRLHIINSTFEGNATRSQTDEDNQGGAIFSANSFETIITGSLFVGNDAGSGGAFGGIATGLLVYNSRFEGNNATDDTSGGIVRGHGGAIHLDGVTNSFNPNSRKTVDICGTTFVDNTAVRGGGAIKSTVSDGQGTKLTVDRSSFRNNRLVSVPPTEGHGGAIYHIEDDDVGATSEDNLEIRATTFEGNVTYRQGGGAWLLIRGQGQIINSTFAANRASEAGTNRIGQGGGLIVSRGEITVESSTFANNFATYQGGALFAGNNSTVTLTNSLFANNTLDPTHTNPVTTEFQGYHTNRTLTGTGNLQFPRNKPDFGNDANNIITNPPPLFADPLLGPLADNGGPTQTFALQDSSPAIDAGVVGCPAVDQRGESRVAACDIGAFEFQPVATQLTFAAGPANPTEVSAVANATDVPVLQVVATAQGSDVTLEVLQIELAPTQTTLASIRALTLYNDQNADGQVDLGDQQLASQNVNATNATTLDLVLDTPLSIPANTSVTLLVTYDFGTF